MVMLDTVSRPTGAPDDLAYKALTVRLPRDIVDQIKVIAETEERSINYIAARLLRQALKHGND